jgi:probable F420-dependent oxidoreductase
VAESSGPVLDVLLDATAGSSRAAELERAGFGGLWTIETVRDPYLQLAQAGPATQRSLLGTAVAVAFARSPMTTALCAHDLQRLSNGRFRLGLGSQVRAHITRRFSMPWSQPVERMRDYVHAVRAIWTAWNEDAPLDFRGQFYEHTLMTPYFNPGPSGFVDPPVLLGGVGPRMIALAGEIADGYVCGPLTSALTFRERTLPTLAVNRPFELVVMPLVVTGVDSAQSARVAAATRARIAFYASTPAYRDVLAQHGWAAVSERLHAMSVRGEWDAMAAQISDEILDTFAIVAEPDAVAAAIRSRFGTADRAIVHSAADLPDDLWATMTEPVAA